MRSDTEGSMSSQASRIRPGQDSVKLGIHVSVKIAVGQAAVLTRCISGSTFIQQAILKQLADSEASSAVRKYAV